MQSTRSKKSNYRDPSRWNTVSVPERVAERAYTRCNVDDDGCWVSTYSTASHGYAQIGWSTTAAEQAAGKPRSYGVLAHRASWTHVNGQVPIGMTLDHLCKNRRCVNPAHLRLLSNYENARRNTGDDWEFGRCRNGHTDTMLREVPRTAKSGRKYMGLTCSECERESKSKWAEANPERVDSIRRKYRTQGQVKAREWYERNRELTKARTAEWKRNNPEKVRESNRAYKARKKHLTS